MGDMNLYQKMLAITADLSTVAKNLEVGYGATKYNAVGEADVLRAVKPLEAKYGVYSYPANRRIVESGTIENETIDKATKEKVVKRSLFERIEVVYRFVNVENTAESIEITSYGDGVDAQDKSVGKAMTYADKYALMKAYKIITGDDPDQNASEPMVKATTRKNKQNVVLCDECLSEIKPFFSERMNARWSVEDIVSETRMRYGACLCKDCWEKRAKKKGDDK